MYNIELLQVVRIYAPGQSIVKSPLMDPYRDWNDDWRNGSLFSNFYNNPLQALLQYIHFPLFFTLCIILNIFGNVAKNRALEREFQGKPRAREKLGRRRIERLFDSCSSIGVLRVRNVDRKTLDIIRRCLCSVRIERVDIRVKRSMLDFPRNDAKYVDMME